MRQQILGKMKVIMTAMPLRVMRNRRPLVCYTCNVKCITLTFIFKQIPSMNSHILKRQDILLKPQVTMPSFNQIFSKKPERLGHTNLTKKRKIPLPGMMTQKPKNPNQTLTLLCFLPKRQSGVLTRLIRRVKNMSMGSPRTGHPQTPLVRILFAL